MSKSRCRVTWCCFVKWAILTLSCAALIFVTSFIGMSPVIRQCDTLCYHGYALNMSTLADMDNTNNNCKGCESLQEKRQKLINQRNSQLKISNDITAVMSSQTQYGRQWDELINDEDDLVTEQQGGSRPVPVWGRGEKVGVTMRSNRERGTVSQPISSSSRRQLPQAIIMGVKKGGTRALLEFLRVHPDVRAAGPETHFFDKHYHRGLDWYRRQMPKTLNGQLTIEKTPSYFVTRHAPSRVHHLSRTIGSDIRLILVVRDPVTRAISDYTQVMSKRDNTPSFSELAFVNTTSVGGEGGSGGSSSKTVVDTSWGAIRIGLYARHLERWLVYFPLHNIHVVNGERLISDPAGEMGRLQDFLGLKRLVTEKHFFFNETKGFPCLKKGEGSSGRPRCLGNTKGRTHPHVSDDVIRRLRAFYRPFNRKFYRMTGVDFGWP